MRIKKIGQMEIFDCFGNNKSGGMLFKFYRKGTVYEINGIICVKGWNLSLGNRLFRKKNGEMLKYTQVEIVKPIQTINEPYVRTVGNSGIRKDNNEIFPPKNRAPINLKNMTCKVNSKKYAVYCKKGRWYLDKKRTNLMREN